MLVPMSEKDKTAILKSFKRVFETGDCGYLNMAAYKFISGAINFIAHYDIDGFRCEYSDVENFKREILAARPHNQYRNFHGEGQYYDYYMQKRDIYNGICTLAETVGVVDPETVPYSPSKSPKTIPDHFEDFAAIVKKEADALGGLVYSSYPYCCAMEECLLRLRNSYIDPKDLRIERQNRVTLFYLGKRRKKPAFKLWVS
jgi:hypothetical protein